MELACNKSLPPCTIQRRIINEKREWNMMFCVWGSMYERNMQMKRLCCVARVFSLKVGFEWWLMVVAWLTSFDLSKYITQNTRKFKCTTFDGINAWKVFHFRSRKHLKLKMLLRVLLDHCCTKIAHCLHVIHALMLGTATFSL